MQLKAKTILRSTFTFLGAALVSAVVISGLSFLAASAGLDTDLASQYPVPTSIMIVLLAMVVFADVAEDGKVQAGTGSS